MLFCILVTSVLHTFDSLNVIRISKFKLTLTMQLTTEQRVFIVEQFYVTDSPTEVKRAYVNKYRVNINLRTVDNLIKKWKDKGTMLNQKTNIRYGKVRNRNKTLPRSTKELRNLLKV